MSPHRIRWVRDVYDKPTKSGNGRPRVGILTPELVRTVHTSSQERSVRIAEQRGELMAQRCCPESIHGNENDDAA